MQMNCQAYQPYRSDQIYSWAQHTFQGYLLDVVTFQTTYPGAMPTAIFYRSALLLPEHNFQPRQASRKFASLDLVLALCRDKSLFDAMYIKAWTKLFLPSCSRSTLLVIVFFS